MNFKLDLRSELTVNRKTHIVYPFAKDRYMSHRLGPITPMGRRPSPKPSPLAGWAGLGYGLGELVKRSSLIIDGNTAKRHIR